MERAERIMVIQVHGEVYADDYKKAHEMIVAEIVGKGLREEEIQKMDISVVLHCDVLADYRIGALINTRVGKERRVITNKSWQYEAFIGEVTAESLDKSVIR